ncbi:hypothetical protein Hanom_Chr09g00784931 [Helianthus anomalus]
MGAAAATADLVVVEVVDLRPPTMPENHDVPDVEEDAGGDEEDRLCGFIFMFMSSIVVELTGLD